MRLLGIPDPQVWLAYTLSVLACLVCVGYGLVNWNKDE
ncbi:MAG: symporter small accessory protein [Bacillota bacterium]